MDCYWATKPPSTGMATTVTNEAESEQSQRTTWATSAGEPFEYYDLGHGYCTYSFFALCPQRMACARCDFYLPEDSSSAQPLEANDSLQRMLVEIPLTEEGTPPPKATSKQSRVSSTTSATWRLLPNPHRAKLNSSRSVPRCQRAGARLQPTASSAHEPSASPGIRAKSHPRSLARATSLDPHARRARWSDALSLRHQPPTVHGLDRGARIASYRAASSTQARKAAGPCSRR
jgi:hypothetical protein